jgi:hypothetical protein
MGCGDSPKLAPGTSYSGADWYPHAASEDLNGGRGDGRKGPSKMPIECPTCRMVTGNDRASHCIACGRKFFRRERRFRGLTSWWAFCFLRYLR